MKTVTATAPGLARPPGTDRQQAYLRTLRRQCGLPVRAPDDLTIGRADE